MLLDVQLEVERCGTCLVSVQLNAVDCLVSIQLNVVELFGERSTERYETVVVLFAFAGLVLQPAAFLPIWFLLFAQLDLPPVKSLCFDVLVVSSGNKAFPC